MGKVKFRDFTKSEHGVWQILFDRQTPKRSMQMVDLFSRGLEQLKISGEKIPDLSQINRILESKTGFRGVPVEGYVAPAQFFLMLKNREFPVGNFIRDVGDLAYTPAPDVFHDLYGHLPFFVDKTYADFCQEYGKLGAKYIDQPQVITELDRLFWFTIEFALVMTPQGKRIFGAGIASSFSECAFALSDAPEVLPFDLRAIRQQPFKIDEFQRKLFLLRSPEQLYGCLDEFESEIGVSHPRPVLL